MKKILLACSLFLAFYACKKDNSTPVYSFNSGLDSLHLSYNHSYTVYITRNNGGDVTVDSDFVIFHPNSTISEVSNRFDSTSYTYPDTLTYTANTSYNNNISWSQIPDARVFAFYPIKDSTRHYLLHDYLNTEVIYMYQSNSSTATTLIKGLGTVSDSTAVITGVLK